MRMSVPEAQRKCVAGVWTTALGEIVLQKVVLLEGVKILRDARARFSCRDLGTSSPR
jgi:hypothetical protein